MVSISPVTRRHPTGCKSKRVHAVAKAKGLGIGIRLGARDIRPSFVDTLFPVNRPHPCKPAAWNVIIGDYYYECH